MSEPRYCVPGCTGHLGKFQDCTSEALWSLSLDSGQDATTGDVDWDAWVALFLDFTPGHPPIRVDAGWIGIPPGSYLLYSNDRGYVWSSVAMSAAQARQEFDRIDVLYDEWSERIEHVASPDHHPGYLHDCAACEARCHCTPGSAECVYGGEHDA